MEEKNQKKEGKKDKNKTIDDLDIEADLGNPGQDYNKDKDDSVSISKTKIALIKNLLENVKENNDKLLQLLSGFSLSDEELRISIGQMSEINNEEKEDEYQAGSKIIEGVFDGENMIGPDGKQYSVPANYASKSKLVEGDILKLTITPNGTFVYKQIGPIERSRLVGRLEQNSSGGFIVISENDKKLKVLTASVTYFKGKAGDEVVVLIPKTGESKWAAVENIVKSHE